MASDEYGGQVDHGRPMATDVHAEGAQPDLPPFVSRPVAAPVYYGFPILDDVEIDGFRLGMITDFEREPTAERDSFVVAPDGSRAGLVWEVSSHGSFEELCPYDADRWGVWAVSFPSPMGNREQARHNLQAVLPELRKRWQEWKVRFGASGHAV